MDGVEINTHDRTQRPSSTSQIPHQLPHATKAATVELIAHSGNQSDEDPVSNTTNAESPAVDQPVAVGHGRADNTASPKTSGSTSDSTNMNAGTGVDSMNVNQTVSPSDTRRPSNIPDGVVGSVNHYPDGSQILSKLSSRGWEWSWRWAWIDENTEDITSGAS